MIVFDLRCAGDHVFEAWFGSSKAFEEQRARGLLLCPVCGDADIGKAVMAPNIGVKGNARSVVPVSKGDVVPTAVPTPQTPTPETIKAALGALAVMQQQMLATSQWVGTAFADRARGMHFGDIPVSQIHGQTTRAEAQSLAEEGVPVAPLPFPILPPDALN